LDDQNSKWRLAKAGVGDLFFFHGREAVFADPGLAPAGAF
jgi:hypothetical protein